MRGISKCYFLDININNINNLNIYYRLVSDNWNDYGFRTLFALSRVEAEKEQKTGAVKIARIGMSNKEDYNENKSSFVVTLPDKFENLPDDHFSLGMDITFYTNLNKYSDRDEAKEVLMALNDIAYDKELRDSVKI